MYKLKQIGKTLKECFTGENIYLAPTVSRIKKKKFKSPEPKAQVRFSDKNVFIVCHHCVVFTVVVVNFSYLSFLFLQNC